MRVWIGLAVVALALVGGFFGMRSLGPQSILVENVMASSHGGGLVGVTLDVRNTGGPDRLVSVSAPDAEMAILKSYLTEGAPIPANSTVSFVMEGAHIMLGKISGPVQDGRLIPLVLTFENAGDIAAKAHYGKPMMVMDGMEGMSGMSDMDHSMMGMDFDVPDDEPMPGLSVSALPQDDGGWAVQIETSNFTFSREQADGPHSPGTGHGHLYVGGVKIGRVYGPEARIAALPPGRHLISVTLNTNNHQTYVVNGEPVMAAIEITAP